MTSPRAGLSIPIVVTLLAVVGMGLLAAAAFRQSVSRNLAALVRGARAVSVAEAAIAEVASRERLEAVFADPGARAQLAAALQGGTLEAGVLTPQPTAFEVAAGVVAEAYQDDPTLELDPVRVLPLFYYPDRQAQKGVLRFLATSRAVASGRTVEKQVAHDYEFTMYRDGEVLRFLLARAPLRRMYP